MATVPAYGYADGNPVTSNNGSFFLNDLFAQGTFLGDTFSKLASFGERYYINKLHLEDQQTPPQQTLTPAQSLLSGNNDTVSRYVLYAGSAVLLAWAIVHVFKK